MRRDLTSGVLVIVMLAAMVVVGGAQDQSPAGSSDWRAWDEGPEGFLLTKDEAKEWKAITTEAGAKRFIELFWARRNPNPAQPVNTFRAQHDATVRYADANFSYEGKRGALTDRRWQLAVTSPGSMAMEGAPIPAVIPPFSRRRSPRVPRPASTP